MFIMTCPRANVNGVHGARICLRCAYIADMRACCRVHFVSSHAPLLLSRKRAYTHPHSQLERFMFHCACPSDAVRTCCRVHFVSAAMFIPLMPCVHTSVFTSLAPHAPPRLPRKHACIHPHSQRERCMRHCAYLANMRASIRVPSMNATTLTSQTRVHPSAFSA